MNAPVMAYALATLEASDVVTTSLSERLVFLAIAGLSDRMLESPNGYTAVSSETVAAVTGLAEWKVRELGSRLTLRGLVVPDFATVDDVFVGYRVPESVFS